MGKKSRAEFDANRHINIRHIRIFVAAAKGTTFSQVATDFHLSQPAVAQAIRNLERRLNATLFERLSTGLLLTDEGHEFHTRTVNALAHIDPVLDSLNTQGRLYVTTPQLIALSALVETGSYTLASKRLQLAQSSVHRAVSDLESASSELLFERRGNKIEPTAQALKLAEASCRFFSELEEAQRELRDKTSSIKQLKLGVSCLVSTEELRQVIAEFVSNHSNADVEVFQAPAGYLLKELRSGRLHAILTLLDDMPDSPDVRCVAAGQPKLSIIYPNSMTVEATNMGERESSTLKWIMLNKESIGLSAITEFFDSIGKPTPLFAVSTNNVNLAEGMVRDHGFVAFVGGAAPSSKNELQVLEVPSERVKQVLIIRSGWRPMDTQRHFLRLVQTSYGLRDIGIGLSG